MNNKFDVFIVAAGKGSRMNSDTPKILTEINGVPNLWNTFEKLIKSWKFINRVFIVVNSRNKDEIINSSNHFWNVKGQFKAQLDGILPSCQFIEIESGRGDGHAILEAINQIDDEITDDIFIMWGDAYLTSEQIFLDCINAKRITEDNKDYIPMYVPVINEKNPYVTFVVDKDMRCIGADFSKRGECHPSGFHDQCVFFGNTQVFLTALKIMNHAFLKNGRYVTDSGELTFLYIIHYLWNNMQPAKAIITDSPVLSYNTQGEVKDIERILNDNA
jgi:NDP-sugar pyrophosphorylase family protein